MTQSAAEEIRGWANRLTAINEYDTHSDTGTPDREIDTSNLMRLKTALRPLVDDKQQAQFMQILNKMNSGQLITTGESKLLTSAFIVMADVIAEDPSLASRIRKDIMDFNDANKEEEPEEDEPLDLDPPADEEDSDGDWFEPGEDDRERYGSEPDPERQEAKSDRLDNYRREF